MLFTCKLMHNMGLNGFLLFFFPTNVVIINILFKNTFFSSSSYSKMTEVWVVLDIIGCSFIKFCFGEIMQRYQLWKGKTVHMNWKFAFLNPDLHHLAFSFTEGKPARKKHFTCVNLVQLRCTLISLRHRFQGY